MYARYIHPPQCRVSFKSLDEQPSIINIHGTMTRELSDAIIPQIFGQMKTAPVLLMSINSPGGDVDAGFEVYDAMLAAKRHGCDIVTVAHGDCASIATLLFAVGDERYQN